MKKQLSTNKQSIIDFCNKNDYKILNNKIIERNHNIYLSFQFIKNKSKYLPRVLESPYIYGPLEDMLLLLLTEAFGKDNVECRGGMYRSFMDVRISFPNKVGTSKK